MIRLTAFIPVALTAALALTACGGYGGSTSSKGTPSSAPNSSSTVSSGQAASPAKTMTLIVAAHAPQNDVTSQTIKYWGDLVTKETHGRIQFKYHWAGSLVSVAQAFSAVNEGTADIADVASSFLSGKVPAVGILSTPYAFPLLSNHILNFIHAVNPVVDSIYQKHGQKVLFSDTAESPMDIVSTSKFYKTPSDFKNTLARTAGSWQSVTMTAWGGKPVVLGLGDLYTALQRGTVNATLLSMELTKSFKIYEVAKYITNLKSSDNYLTVDINLNKWHQISPKDQKIMLSAGQKAEQYEYQLSQKEAQNIKSQLTKLGAKITVPSTATLKALQQVTVNKVWPKVQKQQGPDGAKVMAVVKQYQKYVLSSQ